MKLDILVDSQRRFTVGADDLDLLVLNISVTQEKKCLSAYGEQISSKQEQPHRLIWGPSDIDARESMGIHLDSNKAPEAPSLIQEVTTRKHISSVKEGFSEITKLRDRFLHDVGEAGRSRYESGLESSDENRAAGGVAPQSVITNENIDFCIPENDDQAAYKLVLTVSRSQSHLAVYYPNELYSKQNQMITRLTPKSSLNIRWNESKSRDKGRTD